MNVLVTRPAGQADRTAARLRSLGHEAILSPLLRIDPVPWTLPPGPFGAVLATSANGFAAGVPSSLRALPLLAVGARAGEAGRRAGFTDISTSEGGGAAALYDLALGRGVRTALHLAGRDVTQTPEPPGLGITRVTTYRAELETLTDAAAAALAAGDIDVTLLYSARTAAQFARQIGRRGLARADLSAAAIAPFSEGLRCGWKRFAHAGTPTEDALFAAAGLLCEDDGK